MLDSLLPKNIATLLDCYNAAQICEVRIRDDKPIVVNLSGINQLLLRNDGQKFIAESGLCEKIISKATEYSLYSQNNQVIKGFITAKGGIRIGICGEVVLYNNEVKTIKNCKSINIRIPREVIGCADKIKYYLFNGNALNNLLIISPPGQGKTTILRDLTRIVASVLKNVLVVDERMELSGYDGNGFHFNLGESSDVITNCDKKYAFTYAIRSMSPDVIVTDELVSNYDFEAVRFASNSGVKVIASIHASCINEVKNKYDIADIFDRYVVLSGRNGPGTIEAVYEKDFTFL